MKRPIQEYEGINVNLAFLNISSELSKIQPSNKLIGTTTAPAIE
jgi:hypothetical protein